jgi:hypothetical protein
MNLATAFAVCGLLAVSACDDPMFHQDRPGGSDYRGYQPSYQEPQPSYNGPAGQAPSYDPPAASETYDRARERQLWSRCDRGDAQACAERHF